MRRFRHSRRRRLGRKQFDWRYKSIPSPGHSFNEPRTSCRIAQYFAELVHRRIQTMIEIDESVVIRPDGTSKLVTADHFAGSFEENFQDPEGLIVEFNPDAGLAQITGMAVEFENSETDRTRRLTRTFHR
jgi:hypothetical protein